jgi:hypothetical protein
MQQVVQLISSHDRRPLAVGILLKQPGDETDGSTRRNDDDAIVGRKGAGAQRLESSTEGVKVGHANEPRAARCDH